MTPRHTQLATVLMGHANRMNPFLGKAGVVDDEHIAIAACLTEGRQYLGGDCREQGRITPVRLGNQVVHGLMCRADIFGMYARGHWLDALAGTGKHQSL